MEENLANALQITVVGMGLVFAAILLLWGLMALLVRLTADAPVAEPPAEAEPTADDTNDTDLKRRVAIAAVSVALAQADSAPTPVLTAAAPRGATLSPWQAANRANPLKHQRQQR